MLGGGSAHPPRDHHAAEAVGAPALSSVGASAPAGASVSVADPGGQTGDSFGQRASVFVPNVAGAVATISEDGPTFPSGKTRCPRGALRSRAPSGDLAKVGVGIGLCFTLRRQSWFWASLLWAGVSPEGVGLPKCTKSAPCATAGAATSSVPLSLGLGYNGGVAE